MTRDTKGTPPCLTKPLSWMASFQRFSRCLCYYPGTEEAHTNPTRQRGECLRPSLARRVSMCKDAKLSCRGNITASVFPLGLLVKRSPTTILSPLATASSLVTDHDSLAQAMSPADGRKLCLFSTSRQRAKSTAGTERIGHGGATHQTANLCSKLNCASLPRPQGRAARDCSTSRIWRTTGYRCGTGPFPKSWRSWPKPPTRRVLCYATAKLLRDEAESMVPNIDPEQVRKLAGWGLTQNDRASFVGWSQSLISLRF